MKVRIGCELTYMSESETPILLTVRARRESRYHKTPDETRVVEPQGTLSEYRDLYGNEVWRSVVGPGSLKI